MGNGEYATILNMSKIWNGIQGFDCYDWGFLCLAKFYYGTRENWEVAYMLPGF